MKRVIIPVLTMAVMSAVVLFTPTVTTSSANAEDPTPSPSDTPTDPDPSPSPSDTTTSADPSPSPSDTTTSADPSPSPSDTTTPPDTRPNVVMLYVDDMPKGILDAMPIVRSELVQKGITFSNGIIPTSICCSSRSSLFTGNYAHSTGVYTNKVDNFGGWPTFNANGNEDHTLATHLDSAGYYTGLIGKYMNSWADYHPAGYIPPGWDQWASMDPANTNNDNAYYEYSLYGNIVPAGNYYASAPSDYSTDVLGSLAADFIRNAPADKPLYLHWAPKAVHGPPEVAPRDIGTWPLEPGAAIPALNEDDLSDKSAWIRDNPKVDPMAERKELTQIHEMAMSLDDSVGLILQALADTGRLDNTIIAFISDNGYMLGAHRIEGKNVPYKLSTNVPMLLRLPGTTQPSVNTRLTPQIDITKTIADLTGVSDNWTMDGKDALTTTRIGSVLEQVSIPTDQPGYCGWRTDRYLFVHYQTGEEEFYDYARDPKELTSKAQSLNYRTRVDNARAKAKIFCTPTPPGFAW